MLKTHAMGLPRIGHKRQLKKSLEAYWKSQSSLEALLESGQSVRQSMWQMEKDAGMDFVTVGDFAWYDQMLQQATLLGVVPERFGSPETYDLNTYFCMARGQAPDGKSATALEMTKWFDTNYHYLVPELQSDQEFKICDEQLFQDVAEAKTVGLPIKAVLIGPMTFLFLSKCAGAPFDKLSLLDDLLVEYVRIFSRLMEQGVAQIQVDEPILVQNLPPVWLQAFDQAYAGFQDYPVMLATYFGALEDNVSMVAKLPVSGVHLDALAEMEIEQVIEKLPHATISLGFLEGRNIWREDLNRRVKHLKALQQQFPEKRFWLSTNCSLLHCPLDLDDETQLDPSLKRWLAFSKQKLQDLRTIAKGCVSQEAHTALSENAEALTERAQAPSSYDADVREAVDKLCAEGEHHRAMPHSARKEAQQKHLNLPLFPTTSIGSFPQTSEIRQKRRDFKKGEITQEAYEGFLKSEIDLVIAKQEALEMDVLVHGEPERNDMVEYFGTLLSGFAFTQQGWVQSYGSRCVKPPIIYGDISRSEPMTVPWTQYAQSKTEKPVKAMLTGPITILCWSFVRDDLPSEMVSYQIASVLRSEVLDLEEAGTSVIQIDEPALREGLPLRESQWSAYLEWATRSFRMTCSSVRDTTQIHTHMCYAEFNDIIQAIAALDADVITIETSRSHMALLEAFEVFEYPNDIGPGVYDIHSPNIPTAEHIVNLMKRAAERLKVAQLWVNPDCGLKTRDWPETEAALKEMVSAAKQLRSMHMEGHKASKTHESYSV